MIVATRTPELQRARAALQAKRDLKQQAFEGLKVNRNAAGGSVPKTKEEMRAFMAPHNRQIAYEASRVHGHESAIERANAQVATARKVKRIGSGVLGAGASLAVLGAVMAERRSKPKAKPAVATAKPPAARLADMRHPRVAGEESWIREDRDAYAGAARYAPPKMYEGRSR